MFSNSTFAEEVPESSSSDTAKDLETESACIGTTRGNDNFEEETKEETVYANDEYFDYEDVHRNDSQNCNCLPACSSIHYDTEISQNTLNSARYFKANKIDDEGDDE